MSNEEQEIKQVMQQEERITKPFSFRSRVTSFKHAWRGIKVFVRHTHAAWLHLVIFAGCIFFGFYFPITKIEWLFVLLAAGLVLTAEAINTAIEIDIDLTSPEFHPYARDTKDVAAGAVLIASIISAIIGIMIFAPHFYYYFF